MNHYPPTRRKAEHHVERWLGTRDAAYELGMSEKTLRNLRDENGGPLIQGVHWYPGLFVNSKHQYEANGIRKRLGQVGKTRRNADRNLRLVSSNDAM